MDVESGFLRRGIILPHEFQRHHCAVGQRVFQTEQRCRRFVNVIRPDRLTDIVWINPVVRVVDRPPHTLTDLSEMADFMGDDVAPRSEDHFIPTLGLRLNT